MLTRCDMKVQSKLYNTCVCVYLCSDWDIKILKVKVKVIPQTAELAQRVPGRLRSRIVLTFDATRVVIIQP